MCRLKEFDVIRVDRGFKEKNKSTENGNLLYTKNVHILKNCHALLLTLLFSLF